MCISAKGHGDFWDFFSLSFCFLAFSPSKCFITRRMASPLWVLSVWVCWQTTVFHWIRPAAYVMTMHGVRRPWPPILMEERHSKKKTIILFPPDLTVSVRALRRISMVIFMDSFLLPSQARLTLCSRMREGKKLLLFKNFEELINTFSQLESWNLLKKRKNLSQSQSHLRTIEFKAACLSVDITQWIKPLWLSNMKNAKKRYTYKLGTCGWTD